MVMRELCSEEGAEKRGWDDAAPPQTVENFRNAISGLGELRHITFPRSIHPDAKVKGAPSLLVFGNGSRDAYCTLAYAHWPMADGSYQCHLISCKTRVARGRKFPFPQSSSWAPFWRLGWLEKLPTLSASCFLQSNFSRIPLRCSECCIVIPTPFRNLSASGLPKSKRIRMSKTGHGFLPMLTQLIWVPGQMWSRPI